MCAVSLLKRAVRDLSSFEYSAGVVLCGGIYIYTLLHHQVCIYMFSVAGFERVVKRRERAVYSTGLYGFRKIRELNFAGLCVARGRGEWILSTALRAGFCFRGKERSLNWKYGEPDFFSFF